MCRLTAISVEHSAYDVSSWLPPAVLRHVEPCERSYSSRDEGIIMIQRMHQMHCMKLESPHLKLQHCMLHGTSQQRP